MQATRKRVIEFVPVIEDTGRFLVSTVAGHLPWEVFDPTGVSLTSGDATETRVDGYSVLSAEIGPFATLGEGYRLEFSYRVEDEADDEITYTHQIFFDVVAQEWQTEVTLDHLREYFPSVAYILAKHGSYFATALTAEEMADRYISNAMDKFDNVLRAIVTHSRIQTRAALVPDSARFDRIIAKVAVGLIFFSDLRYEDALKWFGGAMHDFENMTLLGYDSDGDFIADTEIKAPDRRKAFELEFLGDF